MPADFGGKSRPQNLDSVPRGPVLLSSPFDTTSVIPDCEPDIDGPGDKFAESGPDESVVYDDGNVSITELIEPGLKSITINIGVPPGEVLKPQGQQTNTGRQNAGKPPTQTPPLQGAERPQRSASQSAAQRQSSEPPSRRSEVIIPADSELPICNIPQPEGPPPDKTEWPKNSQANDVCEIQDIDAAAKLKIKYGENPCKPPPPPAKKDKASNKPGATDITNKEAGLAKSNNTSPSNGKAQSSKPLVNSDVSDDGFGPSHKPAQPMGRSVADSDISNYGTPGYSGNHIPKKPACSGGDHDFGGRYQAPSPYDPQPPPQHPWPEDSRRIASSGQYTYPPTPPPPPGGQYSYPPTPPPTPSPRRGYDPPPQDLPPCPPEGDVYYDAQEDFYYDASSQADWCPPGYIPASRPCSYCHSHFAGGIHRASLGNNAGHSGRRTAHIRNAEFQQGQQSLDNTVNSTEKEGCEPLLILEQDSDHTVIIRQRKGHHKDGCPWQRKNHHRIQPGDVRNTSFSRTGLEVLDSDDLKEVQREGKRVLHMDEQGNVHLNAYWQHFEPVVNFQEGGNSEEQEERRYSSGDLVPNSDSTCESIAFFKPHDNACDLTLEEDFEYIHDYEDYGRETEECSEENAYELEPSLENAQATPHHGAELMSAITDQLDSSLEPCTEPKEVDITESESDGIIRECASQVYTFTLQRRRSNPALPLILRLGSWVKDVLLPDYPK